MSPQLKTFLRRWVINTLAVLVVAHVLPGIHYANLTGLAVATLILGILNSFVRPVMLILSLPLLVVTLGLFTFVINALLLLFVSWMLGAQFQVDGFWWAFAGSLLISIVSVALSALTGFRDPPPSAPNRPSPPRNRPPPDNRGGPIIDV